MGMKRKILFFTIALLLGLVIGVISTVKLNLFAPVESQETTSPAKSQEAISRSIEGFGMEDAVVNVANIAGKAVVSISTEHTAKAAGVKRFYFNPPSGQESPFGEDEFFRRFFDEFFGEMPQREYKQMGLGSGVIIDTEGYILTNEHVVNDADKINVILPDGREFKGELKGKDSRSDLAVIKINAHNLPVVSLGDSDNLKIGQWVVAIGNPFGLENSVSAGVISGLNRDIASGGGNAPNPVFTGLIQTDASINQGSSGGALLNMDGDLVGISFAIVQNAQSIGFAIPVEKVKIILKDLRDARARQALKAG